MVTHLGVAHPRAIDLGKPVEFTLVGYEPADLDTKEYKNVWLTPPQQVFVPPRVFHVVARLPHDVILSKYGDVEKHDAAAA